MDHGMGVTPASFVGANLFVFVSFVTETRSRFPHGNRHKKILLPRFQSR